ncbi:hypothetical protein AB3X91_08890 [Paraburkholderia sp. BR14263]|uniref:hypothetical protein n=1 Tax=unclassified Paraburkholderia TaxID=2615204 RepID=UPI0034CF3BEA
MKTIFIFNDSRPTDLEPRFTALGEDARLFAQVEFDERTRHFSHYAFGCTHELSADLAEGITKPLNTARARLLAAYDRIYGNGNWVPVWIESPSQNEAWRRAIDLFRTRAAAIEPTVPSFSNVAFARILDAVLSRGRADAPCTVH